MRCGLRGTLYTIGIARSLAYLRRCWTEAFCARIASDGMLKTQSPGYTANPNVFARPCAGRSDAHPSSSPQASSVTLGETRGKERTLCWQHKSGRRSRQEVVRRAQRIDTYKGSETLASPSELKPEVNAEGFPRDDPRADPRAGSQSDSQGRGAWA
ncbi:hypothetical protein BV20DRAFT_545818 [Pilatotrama ljubarskyi]|nr:hypothetical protein BV20DRAFT_545818 [Pilatotrama ljubarskyi]